ncbi:hypothetical protein ACMFMG_005194 [Clarireedia jacksonii]
MGTWGRSIDDSIESPAFVLDIIRHCTAMDIAADYEQQPGFSGRIVTVLNLAAFEIHLHAEPPGHIQAAIDSILNQETSDDRRAEIHVISKEFRNSCLENVRAHSGEDDFIDPLHTAIKALGIKNLCIHQQAD